MIPLLFVMLIFSFVKIFSSEVYRERYVIRQNIHFELDCNHKSISKTRVKWGYFSMNETIYDSQQPNKIFKSGFEASCQPHNGIISTCILKLVQARKEDSGKYICYVGEENEAMFDSRLKPVTEIELVVRGPTYQNVVANKGDSVVLLCEHNINNLTRARWSHYSIHGVLTYAVYHMPAKETINKNYEALCEPHQLSCNLKILQANKESAGRYICMVGESLEFEEKYGLDQMTHFIEIQLIVGELECNENMNKDLTLIGENDCHGIEADVLNLKCSFNYFGNINYNLLHLRWIEKHTFNSLEKKLNSSLIKHEVKDETNKISIQTNLSVAYEMQNSIFQCVLDDTAVKPCQLNEFRTQYIKNTTERSPPIHSNDLHNMKCSANKSANVQCSYYWVHEIAGAMVETPYPILPVEHMNSPGTYTCLAKCHLGVQKECIIKAMEVEIILGSEAKVSDASHSINWVIVLAVAVIILLLITFATCGCLVFLRRKYKNYKRKYEMEPLKNTYGLNEDDNVNPKRPFSQSQRYELQRHKYLSSRIVLRSGCDSDASLSDKTSISRKEDQEEAFELGRHKVRHSRIALRSGCDSDASLSDKTSTPQKEDQEEEDIVNPLGLFSKSQRHDDSSQLGRHRFLLAHSTLSSLSSGYTSDASLSVKSSTHRKEDQAEATGKKISLSQLLTEDKILLKKMTKYHIIRIYETLLTGKVMMVDGDVCEAEDDANSEQKEIAILPFKSHPNPKDVLIIGGGCVGIVHEMLKNPEVESIILYEIDEQVLALYHIYFPSLACSLDDPRVKVIIGDGNEFLKKQKNAFDVIINCSTNLCGPAVNLINKEYYEIVKSALKDGGVTSSIFHGELRWYFDGFKGLVMEYCIQQFPVVKYLEVPDHKFSDHKIRCFLCSLNPETKFEDVRRSMHGKKQSNEKSIY